MQLIVNSLPSVVVAQFRYVDDVVSVKRSPNGDLDIQSPTPHRVHTSPPMILVPTRTLSPTPTPVSAMSAPTTMITMMMTTMMTCLPWQDLMSPRRVYTPHVQITFSS